MPLPTTKTAWPPEDMAPMAPKFAEWSAWYSGDPDALTAVYKNAARPRPGVVRAAIHKAARFFWGDHPTDLTKKAPRKLHVPVAADLCQASADLLFSEPPTITVDTEDPEPDADGNLPDPAPNVAATMERLDELTGADFHQALTMGAEVAAALGGVYLRATWDTEVVKGRPFLTTVDYDAAWPVFRWGRLQSVTFWRTVRTDGSQVWRHLELHERNADGEGMVYHALYQGTDRELGMMVPLEDDPATANLAAEVDGTGGINTGPGLDVFHWANVTPNRKWRKHDTGRHLGRSDLDGLEGPLDALDEAYTSLMRDISLGKAMLMIPRGMLENHGPGGGASFEQEEVYAPVQAAPSSMKDSGLAVEQVQFKIRVAEHEATIALMWNTIIRSAGYSAQTFGEGGEVAVTATEVNSKERRSALTRKRKGRTVRPVLEDAAHKLLVIDRQVFRTDADPDLPLRVEMGDGFTEDPRALAETANALGMALAASIETRVRLVNPDKDEPWILAEVERIKEENQIELADPDRVGLDGDNLSDAFPDPDEDDDTDTEEE